MAAWMSVYLSIYLPGLCQADYLLTTWKKHKDKVQTEERVEWNLE